MKRWLCHILAGLSLLLLMATVVLWVRGRYVGDDLLVSHTAGGPPWTHVMVQGWSSGGGMRLWIEIDHSSAPRPSPSPLSWLPPPETPFGPKGWFTSYCTYGGGIYPGDAFAGVPVRLGFQWTGQDRVSPGSSSWQRSLTVPAWFLTSIWAAFPVCWVFAVARRWRTRRASRGLCPTCGYDLRAHKPGDKCPECGMVVGRADKPS